MVVASAASAVVVRFRAIAASPLQLFVDAQPELGFARAVTRAS
jgi:hypothetical protein